MTTLYEKIGRRYHPVSDREAMDGLPNGIWLVDVSDGLRTTMRALDPDLTFAQLAAVPRLREVIAAELVEHSRSEPSSRPTTPKERRAWAAYVAVMGDDATLTLTRPSAYEVAERVAKRLVTLAGVPLLNSTKALREDMHA